MKKGAISSFFKSASESIAKHSPEILTGIGIGGMGLSVIFAVKQTPKAEKIIEELKLKNVDATKMDVVKATWKCYISPVVAFGLSSACLISSVSINCKRNAAIAAAYHLSETAFREFREKTEEVVGKGKVKKINDAIAEDSVKNNSPGGFILTNNNKTLCYDKKFGRYFESDISSIKKAENIINKRMMDESYASVNDLYELLGIPGIEVGDQLGWKIEDGLLDIEISAQIAEDDRPCIVISYNIVPKYDYDKFA